MENGQHVWAEVVKKILNHGTENDEHVKMLVTCNDGKIEELMTCNELCDVVEEQHEQRSLR